MGILGRVEKFGACALPRILLVNPGAKRSNF